MHWAGILAGLYLVLVASAYVLQRRLQYFPDPEDPPLPPGAAAYGVEDVTFQAEDGVRLRAWYLPGGESPCLVIFHGNAGNRGSRWHWARALHGLGYGVFLLDYRGYGGSEGTPSEEGFQRDAEAAVRWLERRGARGLVYVGESIGSGVAVELARRRPPAALILQSAFTSAVDVARRAYPFLPVGLLMKDRYENLEKIRELHVPVLVIHGDQDRIVPIEHARRLYEAARGPKRFLRIPGADHNDSPLAAAGREYLETIAAFLDRYAAG